MNDLTNLLQIQNIVQVQYELVQQKFQEIALQEGKLRAALDQLTRDDRTAQQISQETSNLRAVGVDLTWASWVGKTRTKLNLELARVMAQKEPHLVNVRRAYGKVMTIADLVAQERKQEAKRANSYEQERSLTLLQMISRINSPGERFL